MTAPWTSRPDLPDTHFLDNRIYRDARVYAAEQAGIFRRAWKLVAHESELAEAGRYRTVQVGDAPLVLLRGQDGAIRAFLNVCPHRGAQLVRDTAGTLARGRMQCFYHLWSFADDGRCVAIPRPEGYADSGVKAADYGLRRVRCETFLGLVFVTLDDDAPPLLDWLGPAADDLRGPLGNTEFEVFHYHRAEIAANWKQFVETNGEGYHELLHVLNRTTGVAQADYRKRLWKHNGHGHYTFTHAKIDYDRLDLGARDGFTLPGMQPSGHVVVDLFPDAMINIRATVIRIDTVTPLGPDRTLLEFRGLGLKGEDATTRAQRIRHHNQVWGPMGRNLPEDFWAVESQYRNLSSGAYAYSLIAREEANAAMCDSTIRSWYAQWRTMTGIASHDIDRAAA